MTVQYSTLEDPLLPHVQYTFLFFFFLRSGALPSRTWTWTRTCLSSACTTATAAPASPTTSRTTCTSSSSRSRSTRSTTWRRRCSRHSYRCARSRNSTTKANFPTSIQPSHVTVFCIPNTQISGPTPTATVYVLYGRRIYGVPESFHNGYGLTAPLSLP